MNSFEINILRAVLAGFEESYGWDYWNEDTSLSIPGLGYVVCIEKYVPQEDSGRPANLVFSVLRNNETLYFRKSAYYDSYDGVDWKTGEFRQVKPVEKVVYDYV
jgi:hypothetical protein